MKIFEIGVGEIIQSRTLQYIGTDVQCYLFEPNKKSFKGIEEKLGKEPNFHLHNFALGDEEKTVKFFLEAGGSYIEGVKSPVLVHNPNFEKEHKDIDLVEVKNIQDYDDGIMDVLLLDVEGYEYNILKKLISRPKTISVEMYSFGAGYINPNFHEIMFWMRKNGYRLKEADEDFLFEKA